MQFLPHSLHCHTNHEPLLLCVCLSVCVWVCVCGFSCGSAQCPVGAHPFTPYLYSSLIAFFPPIVLVLNAEKIDIHWSIAKRSKYCPPQKAACPLKEVLNQSLPSWNKKVEPSGRKSWSVASCNENVPLLRHARVERLYNVNDMFPYKPWICYELCTHSLVNIAY